MDLRNHHILITGASGSIGFGLCERLQLKGARVRLLMLPGDAKTSEFKKSGAEIFEGDITEPESLIPAIKGVQTVYHMAAVILSPFNPEAYRRINYQGTLNMLKVSEAAGVEHFIYISSASVTYPLPNDYSSSKLRAEEAVKAYKGNYTIVRPTLAYNNYGGEEFFRLVAYLKKTPWVFLPGDTKALKSPVHIEDIIAGLESIWANPLTYQKLYNFSGDEAIAVGDLCRLLLSKLELRKPIVPLPLFLCKIAAAFFALVHKAFGFQTNVNWQTLSGLTQNANLDNTLAKQDLDFASRDFNKALKNIDL